MPNSSPAPVTYEGAFDASARRQVNGTFAQQLVSNTTVVQATNPTSAAALMSASLQGGTLSRVGQTLQINGAGIVNLTTSTATVTFTVVFGGVTIATIVTGSYAVGAINLSWVMNLNATVATIDAGGNVTLEVHGTVSSSLTTLAGALTMAGDSNVAVSSSIAAASAQTLVTNALISAGNAASFVNQRQLVINLLN